MADVDLTEQVEVSGMGSVYRAPSSVPSSLLCSKGQACEALVQQSLTSPGKTVLLRGSVFTKTSCEVEPQRQTCLPRRLYLNSSLPHPLLKKIASAIQWPVKTSKPPPLVQRSPAPPTACHGKRQTMVDRSHSLPHPVPNNR
jgi:hypothetical protein